MKNHYEDDEMLGELFHFTGVKSFVFIYIGTEIEYDRKYFLMYDVREKIVIKSSTHPGVSLFYQKLYK